MTGRQRKYLRGLAHTLKPVVHVGKQGLSETVSGQISEALNHHELIKVKFGEAKDEKNEICAEIEGQLGAERVGMIGHVAIFYRPAEDPEERKIRLPQ